MTTRGEIKTKLTPMLLAVGTSTYFTPVRIESAIDDAYLAVGSAKQWPDIKKGFVTHTNANENYVDYPSNCQSESIFKISVDGNSAYEKWDFEDWMKEIELHPTSDKHIFSEYGRQVFMYPTPTLTGVGNLILWGIIQVAPFLDDGDPTMFSGWADVVNEAILQYAYSNLIQNFDTTAQKGTLSRSQQARDLGDKIINQEWNKIAIRLQRKLKNDPQWDVPDYFAHTASGTGNFTR
jgi:hypothetical protein